MQHCALAVHRLRHLAKGHRARTLRLNTAPQCTPCWCAWRSAAHFAPGLSGLRVQLHQNSTCQGSPSAGAYFAAYNSSLRAPVLITPTLIKCLIAYDRSHHVSSCSSFCAYRGIRQRPPCSGELCTLVECASQSLGWRTAPASTYAGSHHTSVDCVFQCAVRGGVSFALFVHIWHAPFAWIAHCTTQIPDASCAHSAHTMGTLRASPSAHQPVL